MLEWKIAQSGIIKYSGDLSVPPDQKKIQLNTLMEQKKTIRSSNNAGNDSDDEFLNN